MKRRKPKLRPALAERREIAVREVEEDEELLPLPPTVEERALRRDAAKQKFDVPAQDRFLTLYATGATEREAARAVGVSVTTVRRFRRRDEAFEARYKDAREFNTDEMEDTLRRIAADGHVTAIFGILRARRPDVWRERAQLDATVTNDSTASAALFAQLIDALNGRTKPAT